MKKHLLLAILLLLFISPAIHAACGAGQTQITVIIVPDNYPSETSWSLRDGYTNALIDSGGINSDSVCVLNNRCIKFTIYDAFGDAR